MMFLNLDFAIVKIVGNSNVIFSDLVLYSDILKQLE